MVALNRRISAFSDALARVITKVFEAPVNEPQVSADAASERLIWVQLTESVVPEATSEYPEFRVGVPAVLAT